MIRCTVNVYAKSSIPVEYIDSIENREHVALFYDDPEYARIIEFRFIKNGLSAGQNCIYATEEDSGSIVLKMLKFGIPIKYFETGSLKVYQIHHALGTRDQLVKNCKDQIGTILSGIVSPFRIVLRIVPNVSTQDGISLELELERLVHKNFEDFGGSLICPYEISKIESSKRKEWLSDLRENHHAIIYAPQFGQGGVFTMIK